jgi:hypothetical protein
MFDIEDDLSELRAECNHEARYRRSLMRNPDCRDPDHPGCECCEEQED